MLRPGDDPSLVTLKHPSGTFTAAATLTTGPDGRTDIEEVGIIRTARELMDGTAFPRP